MRREIKTCVGDVYRRLGVISGRWVGNGGDEAMEKRVNKTEAVLFAMAGLVISSPLRVFGHEGGDSRKRVGAMFGTRYF
ncbi:hypothetical protein HPP92_020173 [Vanilla planifolia]|uniref:Uncharacterized protein n=1 Tax=Vanilla planifolia TaxID=51239 RepID=A0A835UI79_VANPL|nr:hypothetical protein HPP92_020163 [Vanilla planifolia]KAG0464104.1 hypothetical protein HPP92_020173 [Vanilla planifolia]